MAVEPNHVQLAAIVALIGTAEDGPLVMLNLNRYRDRAVYEATPPGGESANVSGREAYGRYGATAVRVIKQVGGRVLWATTATMVVVGDDADAFHDVVAVQYPNLQAFIDLVLHPDIEVAAIHRRAGLLKAVIARCDVGYPSMEGAPA